MRLHVELDLLGQPQLVVEQSRQPVASPGPGFDLEAQGVAFGLGAGVHSTHFYATSVALRDLGGLDCHHLRYGRMAPCWLRGASGRIGSNGSPRGGFTPEAE